MGIRFEGAGQLEKRLLDLSSNADKKIMRQALRAGAKDVQRGIIAAAPVKDGKLKNTVKVRAGRRSRVTTSYQITVGGEGAGYAGPVEFGHAVPHRDSKGRFRKKQITDADAFTGGEKIPGLHFGHHGFEQSSAKAMATINQVIAERLAAAAEGKGGEGE